VAYPVWRPDGRAIAFTARRRALAGEDEPKSDVKVWSEQWRPHAVATVPVYGGWATQIGPVVGHVWAFAYSPDGERIAAATSTNEDLAEAFNGVRILVFGVDGTGDEWDVLSLSGQPGTIAWSPDGTQVLAMGAQAPDPSHARIFVIQAADGPARELPEREMSATGTVWQGEDVLVLSAEGQVSRLDRIGARGAAFGEQQPRTSILGPQSWVQSLSASREGETIAFTCAFPNHTAEVYAARGNEPARCLTDLNPQLADIQLATMEQIAWQGSDGLKIEGWLLLPHGRESEKHLPLIVHIHGGPAGVYGSGIAASPHNWGQMLAAAGYAVLMPNPRGSTGRGASFTRSNRYDFGGQDFQDIMAGVDHLIAEGIVDGDRMGVCGWSYGGFMTSWVVGHTDRFKAAVAGAPPTNWVSKIGTTDIGPANSWNIGTVWEQPDQVWERSPIRYVNKVTTPTLLVGGDADKRVPITQAQEFYWSLKVGGVPTELVIYPRQKHGFHERMHQLDLAQRVRDWFAQYIPQ
jgi:dipeptidyl aminopeptidase/acylaminoacyl peptidase